MMTDTQAVFIGAAIMRATGIVPNPLETAWEMYRENKIIAEANRPAAEEAPRKAVLSKPTVAKWNEAHEERRFGRSLD
jgi:hypothetical protein